jgi:hypothetical protein
MYDKPDDRSGIDVRREDPFEMSLKLLFNDPAFEPEASDSALSKTQSALDEMAAAAVDRPHQRKAEVIKIDGYQFDLVLPMCGASIRSPDNKIRTHFQTSFFLIQPLKSVEPRCSARRFPWAAFVRSSSQAFTAHLCRRRRSPRI